MPVLTRVLGADTAAYSATIVAAPAVPGHTVGLTTATCGVTPAVPRLVIGTGVRDAAIGLAIVLPRTVLVLPRSWVHPGL
ncbi:hypothetical protein ABZ816_15845 [Actinosynnema sp. NPDC047251]|uniref:hypothetical protein n=1 Tax=Saccharothrix espanaensis TaxID=103731 RepID=UPI0006841135|nr:hypothetical protein [Saccharothrix espanaensis]